MKTTQVVSGFILGASLLLPAVSSHAYVAFDDGGTHIINDTSLLFEYVEVRNGTTLRLESGAVVGAGFNESGLISVFDNSAVVVAGAQLGGDGGSSGVIYLYDSSQLLVESGTLGGAGQFSGQVAAFNEASIVIQGGSFGGTGVFSGTVGLFDSTTAEVQGGSFGGTGDNAGLFIGFGMSATQIFACETGLPAGPLEEVAGTIIGVTGEGAPIQVPFMREATAIIAIVEHCDDGGGVDTDGDGVPDAEDHCPESDLRPTVWIRNLNTGIPNQVAGALVNAEGCSLADLIHEVFQTAAGNARNHGEFVRAVVRGLQELRREGLLPVRFHGHLSNCAARLGAAGHNEHKPRILRRRR